MQVLGVGIPKFTYGITLNAEYKGFDLTIFGTGAAGNKIYNLMVSADRPLLNGIDEYWKNSWTESNTNAKYPDMKKVLTSRSSRFSWVTHCHVSLRARLV